MQYTLNQLHFKFANIELRPEYNTCSWTNETGKSMMCVTTCVYPVHYYTIELPFYTYILNLI